MSKGRRITEFALGGLALLVAFSVGGYILGFGLGEQAGERQANADTYAKHAQDEIDRTCARLDGVAQTECIVRVVEATNEHKRSEDDLSAQRNMARWALLMLIATVAMAIITAFGVYYVWRTLLATQQMARDTKDVGNKQVIASDKAVDEARVANAIVAKQFRAGFKPWISVEMKGPFLDMIGQGNPIQSFQEGETQRPVTLHVNTFIHCIGDIPATIEDFELRLMEGVEWPYVRNPPQGFGASGSDFFTIMPSKSVVQVDARLGITEHPMAFNSILLTPENRTDFMMNPPPIIGKVIYSDPVGVRYEHRFAFVANPTWGDSFKRWGGREYNGEDQIN